MLMKKELVNELKSKIKFELEKDKMLEDMKLEYMTELKKVNKIRTDVYRVKRVITKI